MDKASDTIKSSGKGRLPKDVLFELLKLSAEGNEQTKIKQKIKKKYNRDLAYGTIKKYQKEFAPKIMELAAEWENEAISTGLARRASRIKKLQRVADGLEALLLPEDSETINLSHGAKALTEYRETLKQIGIEVGDLGSNIAGDVNFIGMDDDSLTAFISGKLNQHKDLASKIKEKTPVPIVVEPVDSQATVN